MNVESIEVDLSLRTPEEGGDLGLHLFRRHARRTLAAGAIAMAPVWALFIALGQIHPAFALIGLWWCKPVLDRVALFVLSRAVFGAPPTIRQTIAALPGLLDRRLLRGLTLQRLQLRRSFYLPVAVLEGLEGRALRDRYSLVSRHGAARAAATLTFAWLHIEMLLSMALSWLVTQFLPDGLLPTGADVLDGAFDGSSALYWLSIASYLPVLLVCECAYVASGLGVYLSRRTELEGWDIQLAFQRLTTRLAAKGRGGIAVAILAAACAFAWSSPALAHPQGSDAQATPREVADEILASDAFDRMRTIESLEFDFGEGAGGGGALGPLLATIAKVLACTALAGLLLGVAISIARRAEAAEGATPDGDAPRPTEAFGLDLRQASLPADVAAEARRLAAEGDHQGALSLLYRGALVRLVDDHGLPIEAGDTEHDCMGRVARRLSARQPALVAAFRGLTRTWLEIAWAGAEIDAEAALRHCDVYAETFGATQVAAA